MVKVNLHGQMVLYMMVNFKIIELLVKVYINGLMEVIIKDK